MEKEEKINEILSRGVSEIIDRENLAKKIKSGKVLRVKLGIDPTSPDIHIGRSVPLLKLKDFQDLGHQIIFIVGDFTGLIGDTSDKDAERKMLTEDQIKTNMKNYIDQAGKILNIDKVEIRYNSEWLANLTYKEIGYQADQFSVADFTSRENIKKRLDEGKRVSLREVLYPLMQGYDSVKIKADIELGGTDQKFNLLAGRTLQARYDQEPQDILMTNLIMGTDGRKMSSSWGNVINIFDEPEEMFGKIMSTLDEQIVPYFEHCTRVPMEQVKSYEQELKNSSTNPRDIKMILAEEIVKIYWSENQAKKAKEYFIKVFQKKELPVEIIEKQVRSYNLIDILVEMGLASSRSEARRLISQKGIKVNEQVIEDENLVLKIGDLVSKGKREFFKIG